MGLSLISYSVSGQSVTVSVSESRPFLNSAPRVSVRFTKTHKLETPTLNQVGRETTSEDFLLEFSLGR